MQPQRVPHKSQRPAMRHRLLVLALSLSSLYLQLASSLRLSLPKDASLSVENPDDILISSDGVFSAGFYAVGNNAYCFAIWYSRPICSGYDCTVVWMANRDQPINGRSSKFSLKSNGGLVISDADGTVVWEANTGTISRSPEKLELLHTGNLVLRDDQNFTSWQSFDSPTDTILPGQNFTRNMALVSSKSQNNFSSGYYKFYFDNDNILRLLYHTQNFSGVYWPEPWLSSWNNGRTTFNSSRVAILDSYGNFTSSDGLKFLSTDYGVKIQRRLTLDLDGNLRLYSRSEGSKWTVSWQAVTVTCAIHGICGSNSMCTYDPTKGRSCVCAPGYERDNLSDWSDGCKPTFGSFCNSNVEIGFVKLSNTDFYGYEYDGGINPLENCTLEICKQKCLDLCNCKAIEFRFEGSLGYFVCYLKIFLRNGYQAPFCRGNIYLKLPKSSLSSYQNFKVEYTTLQCPPKLDYVISRTYMRRHESWTNILLIVAGVIAGAEAILLLMVSGLLIRTQPEKGTSYAAGYQLAPIGFIRFTYDELKKASHGFRDEVGRGSGGIVYRGTLSDGRKAAIKLLNEANQGENEFLAEVSTIGMLHHMNLIEMWGYCAEGKHRLLVYEFMDNGSLAENLSSPVLDWTKRFKIALGSAKGLAYVHEECLEWILHCDVKPQNILLDSNYQPKVADFGLSKILDRSVASSNDISFSRIRGTRGYMAPEWVYNMPITSKVDVYSYGIVLLEMVTGRSPAGGHAVEGSEDTSNFDIRSLIRWVREKVKSGTAMETLIEEFVDPNIRGSYETDKIVNLVKVAFQCTEEGRDARPTMSQVVEMLPRHES